MTEQQLEDAVKHAHRHYAPREGERLWFGDLPWNQCWYWDIGPDTWAERDDDGTAGWRVFGPTDFYSEETYTLQEALRLGRALVEEEKT